MCLRAWMHACGLMFSHNREESSQWNCYWLWPVDLLSWLCSSLIQPLNLWLFMAAEIAWMEAMLMLLAKCFTGERAARKGTVIIINGLHYRTSLLLSHQFAGIMRTAPVSVCGFSQEGETWRLKRTRLAEVDAVNVIRWDPSEGAAGKREG